MIKQKSQKIKSLTDEIERRKFMETKVQTYVKSLCMQNQKCKDFISEMKVRNNTKELVNNFIIKEAILNNIVSHFENQI